MLLHKYVDPIVKVLENLATLFPVVGVIKAITVGRSENWMVVDRKEGVPDLWLRCLQVSSLHFVNLSLEGTNWC